MYLLMENHTQNRPSQRKNIPPKDLLLIALAVLVIFRVDWGNMNSFHYLILFLLFLCFMLRWANMRKEAQRKEMMERRRAAEAAAKAAQEPAQLTGETAVPAEEPVPAPEEAAPVEEAASAPEEAAPSEERSEE
ncbi:MAG: hypothetical protein ACI4TP_04675 [Anaerotignum sp.]